MYHRPEDNCCVLYHGDQFTEENKDPVCWDLESGKPVYDKEVKDIKGVDCGKNTWVDFTSSDYQFKIGIAGRQHINWEPNASANTKL